MIGQPALVDDAALRRENLMVLNLVQALSGAVFPNLCGASVEVLPRAVIVHFQLDVPASESDDEDIGDIVVDFEALVGLSAMIGGDNEVSSDVRVGGGHPAQLPGRVAFARKM